MKMKSKKKMAKLRDNVELFILTLPAILSLLVFHYWPLAGNVMAFKDYKYAKGIFGSDWIGLKNFEYFFTSQDALRITRNTVLYNATFIVVGIMCAVIVALLLYQVSVKGAIKTYQTIMILPRFLSWVIVSYIAYILLNPTSGVFNNILEMIGAEGVQWYGTTKPWPVILVISNLWKHVGLDSIIYYSALLGIDQEQFEAAEVDGASKFRQMTKIAIPSILPIIIIMLILKVGSIFGGDFGLFYQIPRNIGTLYPVTDIIPTYVFRGLQGGDYAASTAVGLFQSVVGFVLVIVTNTIVKKIDPDKAMF